MRLSAKSTSRLPGVSGTSKLGFGDISRGKGRQHDDDLHARAESAGVGSSPREITKGHAKALLCVCLALVKGPSVLCWVHEGFASARQQDNKGFVTSTKKRVPFELVYWEGGLNQSDAAHREKYLKSAWGKRYIKRRLQQYLTG
jgi:hypothetical protein